MTFFESAFYQHHQVVVQLVSQYKLKGEQGLEKIKVNVCCQVRYQNANKGKQVEPEIETHISLENYYSIFDEDSILIIGLERADQNVD